MIKGIHGLLYSSDAEATRAFFRDKVKLPGADIGGGWWIFDFAEGDLGIHPISHGGTAGAHDVSFYCEGIEDVVAGMKKRGVVFTKPIEDHGYGLVTYFEVPGGITVQLYEPRYQKGAGTKQEAPAREPTKKATAKKATAKKATAKKATAKKATAKKATAKKATAKSASKKAPTMKKAPATKKAAKKAPRAKKRG